MKKNGPKALSQIIMLRRKEQAAGFACLFFFFLFLHCVVNISLFSNKKTVLSALLDPPGLSMAILSSGNTKYGTATSAENSPSRSPRSGLVFSQTTLTLLRVGLAPGARIGMKSPELVLSFVQVAEHQPLFLPISDSRS